MHPPVSKHSVRTPANAVTTVRIVLAPVLIVAIWLYAPAWWVLAFGFLAMFTDRIDGWLARKYGTSAVGAFLDPLADKIMVLGAFAVLVARGWVWWLPVLIIAAREVAMSWWRSSAARKGISIPARKSAKHKTWVQSTTVALALTPGVVENARWVLTIMVWVSVVYTVVTFFQYVRDGNAQARNEL